MAAQSFEPALRGIASLLVACCALLLGGCANLETGAPPLAQLLDLIEQRLAIADDVARSKWNSGAAVEDLARENEIIDAIGREAAPYGLSPELAKDFFRAQIEASKIIQNSRLAEWRGRNLPKFPDAPDLQRNIRPQLDRLTPLLFKALAQAQPHLRANARMQLDDYAAGNAARATAIAPLRRLTGN